jgi:hypothetical protein
MNYPFRQYFYVLSCSDEEKQIANRTKASTAASTKKPSRLYEDEDSEEEEEERKRGPRIQEESVKAIKASRKFASAGSSGVQKPTHKSIITRDVEVCHILNHWSIDNHDVNSMSIML